jgi:hypothetical protein
MFARKAIRLGLFILAIGAIGHAQIFGTVRITSEIHKISQ